MSFDLPFSLSVQNYLANPILNEFFSLITKLGDWGIFWIIFCLVLLLFKKTRYIGVVCVISFVCAYLLTEVIKFIVGRPRPFQAYNFNLLIKPPSGSSFPSAHSSIAFSVATTYFLLGKDKPNNYIRYLIMALAILIAFSRIYLFVHYLTDVLAGTLIGIIVALFVTYLMRKYISKERNKLKVSKYFNGG